MKTTFTVEAIKHHDVRGKQQTFIKINDELLINIGEKNYNRLIWMIEFNERLPGTQLQNTSTTKQEKF